MLCFKHIIACRIYIILKLLQIVNWHVNKFDTHLNLFKNEFKLIKEYDKYVNHFSIICHKASKEEF